MDKINLVCADTLVGADWEFAEGIKSVSNENWEIKSWDNAGLMRSKFDSVKRFAGYFIHSLWLFNHRNRVNKIVCWQQFYGLIFAFYSCIFHTKKVNKLLIMTFIYKEKKGTLGKIYNKFITTAVRSKYIDKIVVFTESEVELYARMFNVSIEKFHYLPLGIPKEKELGRTKLSLPSKFFLAVGRSNRDYDFLFDCVDGINVPVVVLTDSVKRAVPQNVILFDNIRGDEYKKILRECYAVLIPLKDSNISSGQLVMLQAMQSRKPIIITEAKSIVDYVENDINAIVCKKDKESFAAATNRLLSDGVLYEKLAENGYRKYKVAFSEFALGKNVAAII